MMLPSLLAFPLFLTLAAYFCRSEGAGRPDDPSLAGEPSPRLLREPLRGSLHARFG